jgi:hypothetical protein
MKRVIAGLLTCLACVAFSESFSDRWFYVSRNLNNDSHVEQIAALLKTAGEKDLNGMLLACGIEAYGRWDDARKARLQTVKQLCAENGVEIIPILWSVGYGTMLGFNRNLAVGIPCRDVPYLVTKDKAHFADDRENSIKNGGFEDHADGRFVGYGWFDKPGEVSFVDTEVKFAGNSALRFENFGDVPHGHARSCQEITIEPGRQYRISCMVKTEGLAPARGAFRVQLYRVGGAQLSAATPALQATQDWQEYSVNFNAGELDKINLYIGLWGGQAGKLWLDEVKISDLGVTNVLRRPGTPFTVRSADGARSYSEGVDYEPVPATERLLPTTPEPSVILNLLPGGSIQDGERLLLSYYHPVRYGTSQITVCMSEPELYALFEQSAKHVVAALNPRKWFLSMDEIRAGGTCAACEARNLSMAEILADCIAKQRQIIKNIRPDADVYIWSDMLDPAHNAVENYMLCKGSYVGVWDLIPKDLIISCWYGQKRDISMPFFAQRGFKTQAAAYYDTDNIDGCRSWLDVCNQTPNCTGIMYTTWQNKYELLPAFGDLLKTSSRPLR